MTMQTAVPTYSLAERERRWSLARAYMARSGLDALLVYGEHWDAGPVPYDFDTWFTNHRPGMIVVMPASGEPVALAPMWAYLTSAMEHADDGAVPWISPERMRVGKNAAGIADAFAELGLGTGRIGVLGLEPFPPSHPQGVLPYALWSAVLEQFPGAEFLPVGAAFTRLMLPLGAEQVEIVRHSAGIGEAMARALVEAVAPGVSEADVYAAAMAEAQTRGTVTPAMILGSGSHPMGGGPPMWAYRPQPARVLQQGDVVVAEVFSSFGMSQTQHQVAVAIGEVHEDFERAGAVARQAYEAGLRALRPGWRFGDVVDEILKPVTAAGGWSAGPKIHSLNPIIAVGKTGSAGRLDGRDGYEIPAGPTVLGDMVLEPGMSFALEPCCAFGRRKVTIGGTVIVGDDDPIELNPYTAQLHRAPA